MSPPGFQLLGQILRVRNSGFAIALEVPPDRPAAAGVGADLGGDLGACGSCYFVPATSAKWER